MTFIFDHDLSPEVSNLPYTKHSPYGVNECLPFFPYTHIGWSNPSAIP